MTEWLEYERGGLHETRPDVLEDWDVTMPRLSDAEYRWVAGDIQKYEDPQGRVRWRSLDTQRRKFREGYVSREKCAQELVAECPSVAQRIAHRRGRVLQMAPGLLSAEARAARVAVRAEGSVRGLGET